MKATAASRKSLVIVFLVVVQHYISRSFNYLNFDPKAQLEEEERKRYLQAERAERERRKRLEQARIERLLKDAAAFHQAGAIRKYVEAIRFALNGRSGPQGICPGSFEALFRG